MSAMSVTDCDARRRMVGLVVTPANKPVASNCSAATRSAVSKYRRTFFLLKLVMNDRNDSGKPRAAVDDRLAGDVAASGEARNDTTPATSCGSLHVPAGIAATMAAISDPGALPFPTPVRGHRRGTNQPASAALGDHLSAAALEQCATPVTLTSRLRCHCSAVVSSRDAVTAIPA